MSDELPIDLLTHDFNSRSFFMYLRRENERYQEICTTEHNRQYPSKYSSFHQARGFARLNKHDNLSAKNSVIPSHVMSEDGIRLTDDLSKQLLNDDLSVVCRHWKRSQTNFSNKIEDIQSDFNSHTNRSMKKAMYNCQVTLFNWISKNRLK